jgi:tRNA-binding EMAP/Myf-like protein
MPVVAMKVIAAAQIEQAANLHHYTFSSPNQGELEIVANTTNVYQVGDVAGVALVGTRLPGLTIKPRKVFGIPSSGMACGPVEAPLDADVSTQFDADRDPVSWTVTVTVTVEAAYEEDARALALKRARSEGSVVSASQT